MYGAQARPRCTPHELFMVLELSGRWNYAINAWLHFPKSNSIFSKETWSGVGEWHTTYCRSRFVGFSWTPRPKQTCSWGAVTTCDVCNLRYWKCFVACQGLAAVSITHHAICHHLFLGTSQCSKLEIHDSHTLWALWSPPPPMFTSHISTFAGNVLALSALGCAFGNVRCGGVTGTWVRLTL